MNLTGRKEQKLLALLKAPSRQPKTTTLQVRLEEHVRHNLDKYAEFLNANSSNVVSEGLKFLFRKDKEFKRWLGQHTNTPETQRHTRKEPVSKGESIQLQLE
jgi:type II secretory pathway component HofQ